MAYNAQGDFHGPVDVASSSQQGPVIPSDILFPVVNPNDYTLLPPQQQTEACMQSSPCRPAHIGYIILADGGRRSNISMCDVLVEDFYLNKKIPLESTFQLGDVFGIVRFDGARVILKIVLVM